MQAAYRKAEATHPRENAPKAEEIRSLGLLGKDDVSASVLKSWRTLRWGSRCVLMSCSSMLLYRKMQYT